ncbi:MAG: hypothetical protein KAY24_02710 [Candidatus Eisenbacteria sp.]|nr:hypothetical protein [Candidatus Eisenbacteria bacterium]
MVFLAALYLVVTAVGFFLFRGIPILNVALGFPIGAVVAYRYSSHQVDLQSTGEMGSPGACDPPGSQADRDRISRGPPNCASLRRVVFWGLVTAGVTMLACWAELAGSLLVLKVFGLGIAPARWFPLLSPPGPSSLFRAHLFAIMISPGLQILTTVFGGVVVLLLRPRELPGPL